ncbi:hypothetical protein D0865_03152 [Hortaea werneckii]|uniref:Molybdate-anion transporter n=1 Tax=Hortaea werneckii TaxID=91943 RepID=A0A3M7CZF2_HORWE|nr:hypothetical protein D0865_03152 [Hortaea werneckii]
MEIYAAYFIALTCFNLALFTRQHLLVRPKTPSHTSPEEEAEDEESISLADLPHSPDKQAVWDFKRIYFGVYILATAADWLQGPYIYTLYHDAKALPEPTVAALFTTGFIAAAVSASFTENLAVPPTTHSLSPSTEEKDHQQQSSSSAQATYRDILRDRRLLALVFTTTAFEGSMYLFVFFWSPALKAARASSASARGISLENGGENVPGLPFGLIFASFMSAMMLGSMATSAMNLTSNLKISSRLTLHTVALAAIALIIPVLAKASETGVFWAFAWFETCVGMYFPAMSKLKSEVVEERVRGKVYGMMRVPLNLFVVLALGSTKEGDAYRDTMFRTAGSLLLIAFVVIARYLD